MLIIQTICRASFIYALNDIQTLILIHTNNANAPSIGNASAKTRMLYYVNRLMLAALNYYYNEVYYSASPMLLRF